MAEGAESTEEVEILRTLQCDVVQGYAFGPALPAEEAVAFAEGYEPKPRPTSVPPVAASAYEANDDLADEMISRLRAVVA